MRSDSLGLIDAHFKTERAKYHLEELKAAVSEFCASQAYTLTTEDDVEKQVHRIRVQFSEPHVWITLIAGDAIACLRSALDHAVYRLAQDSVPNPYWTQFPIFDKDTKKTRDKFEQYTRGIVSKEAIEYIKSLQPHSRPQGTPASDHWLWTLNKFWNIDKHRRIPIHSSATDVFLGIPLDGVEAIESGNDYVISMPLSQKPEVALKPRVSVDIVFGDPCEGVELRIGQVQMLYQFISQGVLPRLQSYCK